MQHNCILDPLHLGCFLVRVNASLPCGRVMSIAFVFCFYITSKKPKKEKKKKRKKKEKQEKKKGKKKKNKEKKKTKRKQKEKKTKRKKTRREKKEKKEKREKKAAAAQLFSAFRRHLFSRTQQYDTHAKRCR